MYSRSVTSRYSTFCAKIYKLAQFIIGLAFASYAKSNLRKLETATFRSNERLEDVFKEDLYSLYV